MIHKMESKEQGKQSLLYLALGGLHLSPTPSHILKLIKPVKALTSEMLRRVNKSRLQVPPRLRNWKQFNGREWRVSSPSF